MSIVRTSVALNLATFFTAIKDQGFLRDLSGQALSYNILSVVKTRMRADIRFCLDEIKYRKNLHRNTSLAVPVRLAMLSHFSAPG